MNRFLLFTFIILFSSCSGNRTEKFDDVEIIFYEDGSISAFFGGEDKFESSQASDLNNEGINLGRDEKFEQAKQKFISGLDIEPENPSLINNLGNAEHGLKNFHDAIALYEKSLKASDSTYLYAGLNLGRLYWKNYEFEKSAKVLEYVISKSNKKYELAIAHYQLARTYLDMNVCKNAQIAIINAKVEWKSSSRITKRLEKLEEEIKNCVQHNL